MKVHERTGSEAVVSVTIAMPGLRRAEGTLTRRGVFAPPSYLRVYPEMGMRL